MKILIYGAGVLGSLYAFKLQEAGHDVSLLARGQRLADLRQHGLVMEDMFTGKRTTIAINVIEGLLPGESYDLVLVKMGKHQVGGVLPALAANGATPDVLFMGNNAAGPWEMVAALGPERVLLGFPQAGGNIKEGAQIPMDWQAMWAILIVKAGIILGLVWLLKRRRKTT